MTTIEPQATDSHAKPNARYEFPDGRKCTVVRGTEGGCAVRFDGDRRRGRNGLWVEPILRQYGPWLANIARRLP